MRKYRKLKVKTIAMSSKNSNKTTAFLVLEFGASPITNKDLSQLSTKDANGRTFIEISEHSNWPSNFMQIRQLKSVNLNLRGKNSQAKRNRPDKILPSLRHIIFNDLKVLTLYGCQTDSIQSLSRFRAPALEQMWLNQNNVTSLSPIRKMRSIKLSSINITNNSVQQLTKLSEINSLVLKGLWIQSQKYHNYQSSLLSSIAKLSGNNNKLFLYAQSSKRIINKSMLQRLKQKFALCSELITKEGVIGEQY